MYVGSDYCFLLGNEGMTDIMNVDECFDNGMDVVRE